MITKEEFIVIIGEIEKTTRYTENLNSFFHKNNVEGYLFQPDCTETALRLLHLIFKNADIDDWISYFCYELDFGKKWKEGMIKDKNGVDIKLQTADDLYELLHSYM